MNKSSTVDSIKEAAKLLKDSSHMIAFTGAGISVESGVPSFRGQGGLWGTYDERHLELSFFIDNPTVSWKTIKELFFKFTCNIEPNPAHIVLAKWEKAGILKLVITQNIDGLHSRAGNKNIAEFHGSCDYLVCMRCGKRVETDVKLFEELPPRCSCGGIFKPDFIFFGEGIPKEAYSLSFNNANKADVCLVIGSTGMVYPAAAIPGMVKSRGGKVIEINPEPSEFTNQLTDIFIPLGASKAMEELNKYLGIE